MRETGWKRSWPMATAAFIVPLVSVLFAGAKPASAQVQNQVTVPRMGISDSFYESHGIGFNFGRSGPRGGFFFNNGGGAVAPAFGGFDPNAGATFGVGGPNGGLSFGFNQGSSRSIVGESATVMVPNGGSGAIFSGSLRPFVTGVIPVVGDAAPVVTYPWQQQLAQAPSSLAAQAQVAEQSPATEPTTAQPLKLGPAPVEQPAMFREHAPAGSLSQLRQQRQLELAERREQARQHILSAREAEQQGRLAIARNDYRIAFDLIEQDDPWRAKIIERLRAMDASPSNTSSNTTSSP